MGKKARVSRLLDQLGEVSQTLPDKRAGHHNLRYEMGDAVSGAFSIFFTQSESFWKSNLPDWFRFLRRPIQRIRLPCSWAGSSAILFATFLPIGNAANGLDQRLTRVSLPYFLLRFHSREPFFLPSNFHI